MTVDEQLQRWLAGDPVHNPDRDECCPDFSCCRPELLASPYDRQRFVDATEEERSSMLAEFLGKLLANEGCEVKTSEDVLDDNEDGETWKRGK